MRIIQNYIQILFHLEEVKLLSVQFNSLNHIAHINTSQFCLHINEGDEEVNLPSWRYK